MVAYMHLLPRWACRGIVFRHASEVDVGEVQYTHVRNSSASQEVVLALYAFV